MRRHAQELDEEAIWKHVELYVNAWTRDLGSEGREALRRIASCARVSGWMRSDVPDIDVLGELIRQSLESSSALTATRSFAPGGGSVSTNTRPERILGQVAHLAALDQARHPATEPRDQARRVFEWPATIATAPSGSSSMRFASPSASAAARPGPAGPRRVASGFSVSCVRWNSLA
jgi:hypothetical protein